MSNQLSRQNLSLFGLVPGDFDPWQRHKLGYHDWQAKQPIDSWPHLCLDTLRSFQSIKQSAPPKVLAEIDQHLADCEYCAWYAQHYLQPVDPARVELGGVRLKDSDIIQLSGADDSFFNFIPASEPNLVIAKIQWLISKPGISQGIWTLNLSYNFQTRELVAKLKPSETAIMANLWERLDFSASDRTREGNDLWFSFTPDNLEIKESKIEPMYFDRQFSHECNLYIKRGNIPSWIHYEESLPILTLRQSNNPVDIMIYSDCRHEFYPPDIVSDNEQFLSYLISDHLGRELSFNLDSGCNNQNFCGRIFSVHGENFGTFRGSWDQEKLHLDFQGIPENTYFAFIDRNDGVCDYYRLISTI